MSFLIALLVYGLVILLGITTDFVNVEINLSNVQYFIDLPTLLILLPATLAFSFAAVRPAPYGFRDLFSGRRTDPRKAGAMIRFLNTFGNLSILIGMMGALMGMIMMMANLQDPSTIGPAMAIMLISLLYAACWKSIAYFAEGYVACRAGIIGEFIGSTQFAWSMLLFPLVGLLSFFMLLFSFSKP